ncbi:oxidoreductase fad-binding domain-containing protein [Ophiostoma piceae UAMH 11346]|uniref:Oxidoreductase fad-binding domain-containing protein n=1 Tax=Ophiostoma piceae (strain UAMH 11346) TaxID=1262450 RepID=S3BRD8_OPHP1|nr:oxidoreductase fad-binding domain-containing protein [Ophiostoma piceae UAMH 11346]
MVNIFHFVTIIEALTSTTFDFGGYLDMASIDWHNGEIAVHRKLNGPHYSVPNPTTPGLSQAHAFRVAASPLVAFGTLDRDGRPWTTILGGEAQFTQKIAPNVLGVQSLVDLDYDPVVDALFSSNNSRTESMTGDKGDGGLLRYGPDNGPIVAGLSIDLETKDRVKLAGRMLVGTVSEHQPHSDEAPGRIGDMQLAFVVQEALGNCPKYLNRKKIRPHVPRPQLVYDSSLHDGQLPREGIDLITQADLLFVSSTDGRTMDTNHRGGPPGFLRIVTIAKDQGRHGSDGGSTTNTGLTLIYPEYSGNRLYQTLGNFHVNPLVGIVVPDFDTGTVLYLTGHTKTLVGPEASAYLPHTKLAVHITVDRAILVADGLPFRGDIIDYSPYNPPVRPLRSEATGAAGDIGAAASYGERKPFATAVLTGRHELSPTVSRFTFDLEPVHARETAPLLWHAGQYITFDFSPELDVGWSHMREDDPLSLNDDFIRTFTISSPPPLSTASAAIKLELTLRRHGQATNLLWRHNLRVPLELPVLAFGGDDAFRLPVPLAVDGNVAVEESIFVAAGVGITPLLAQAPGLLSTDGLKPSANFRVLWSLKAADIPVALDSFERIPGLARHTTVFITSCSEAADEQILKMRDAGTTVFEGHRIQRDDIVSPTGRGNGSMKRKIYICTGPQMLQELLAWLPGENLAWESFAF